MNRQRRRRPNSREQRYKVPGVRSPETAPGRYAPTCPTCRKRACFTEDEARTEAGRIDALQIAVGRSPSPPRRYYRCDGGHWHWTRRVHADALVVRAGSVPNHVMPPGLDGSLHPATWPWPGLYEVGLIGYVGWATDEIVTLPDGRRAVVYEVRKRP